MDAYKVIAVRKKHQIIQRLSDGAFIPAVMENYDYREYMNWVKLGYTAAIVDSDGNTLTEASYAPVKGGQDAISKI